MACITDTNSIDLSVTGGQLSADLKLDPDVDNIAEITASGLLITPSSAFPAGIMLPYSGDVAPSGWLLCDGTAVSRATYAGLFAVAGTKFGVGDGSSTFNLPDTRGRVLAGVAPTGGHADVATIGLNDGAALPSRRPKHNHGTHTHSIDAFNHSYVSSVNLGSNPGGGSVSSSGTNDFGSTPNNTDVGTAKAQQVGPSTAPVDAPAYLVVSHIIKT